MRDSSYQSSKQHKQMFSRGGEKKVMKKSLSLLLAIAMVFGLFASVVSAADNELTTQQKFDALKTKGIFAGLADGSAGLDQEMTRAQAARIIALLKGLEGIGDPDTRVVTEKPFPDVDLGKWYTEEVDAVKADGSFKGNADGTFAPNGQLTVQELAVAVAAALGFDATKAEAVEIEGAATWAGSSIKFLQDAGYAVPTNYTANALRGQLVDATFVADAVLNPVVPAEQAVASLNATGAKKLTVAFAKAVEDAAKLKFTVKKGAANVAVASEDGYKWSEDKKSVVITLASKMTAGDYTVTVAPAADTDPKVNDGTKSVTVTDEIIKSIEILTASDTLALYDGVVVNFKASNQYGEQSDLAASAFQISANIADGNKVPSTSKQEVTLKLATQGALKGSIIAVTIVAPNGTATASKTYTVGDAPLVSKVEAGDFEYADDKTKLTAGETAKLKVTAYDQYGNIVADNTTIANSTTLISTRSEIIPSNGADALKFEGGKLTINSVANSVSADTDVQISIVANGSGSKADVIVRVHAPKLPSEIAFDEFTDTVAEGDGTIYLPIVVTDQNGDKLSASEIANHAGKFTLFTTNSSVLNNARIITAAGSNQGKVAVDVIGKGSAAVTAIVAATNKQQSFTIAVQDARVPNSVEVSTAPAKKLLPGAETTLKVKIKDQYGKELPAGYAAIDAYTAVVSQSPSGGDVILSLTGTAGIDANPKDLKTLNNAAITLTNDQGKIGTAKVKVDLKKDTTIISSVTVSVETVKAAVANDLTYEVAEIGTLYASTGLAVGYPAKVSKDVTVKAKDANGVEVGLPADVVKAVYSSDETVASVATPTVTGLKKGTVTLTVSFEAAAGIKKVVSQSVTVDNILPAAESLTVKNATKTIDVNDLVVVGGLDAWNGVLGGDIEMKDQYGISYKNAELNTFSDLTKIKYSVTNVDGGTVTISDAGKITATGAVKSFVVTVYTLTNGKSVSFKVTTFGTLV